MISSNEARNGMLIEYNNTLCRVLSYHHNKTGRGGAVIKLKLRNLNNGATTEELFRPGDKFKRVTLETKSMQYLYADDNQYHFMDTATFDQMTIDHDVIEDSLPYLKEEMIIDVQYHKDKPIGVELPLSVELRVADTDPGLRGDTVSGATKPATMETGLVVQVPLFIERDEILKIDTRSGEYLERV